MSIEYKIVNVPIEDDIEEIINKIATQGWILMSLHKRRALFCRDNKVVIRKK